MNALPPPPDRPRRRYQQSGLHAAKAALERFGSRALDGPVAFALREWKAAYAADLGGSGALSTAQAELLDQAARLKFLVDAVDGYVLTMPSPVDRRHRKLWAVVRERQSLVAQLESLLRTLGLERKARPVPDLAAYLNAKSGVTDEPPSAPSAASAGGAVDTEAR